MKRILAAALASACASAADAPPLKIGVVYSYTGTAPDNGLVLDSAMNAYLLQHARSRRTPSRLNRCRRKRRSRSAW